MALTGPQVTVAEVVPFSACTLLEVGQVSPNEGASTSKKGKNNIYVISWQVRSFSEQQTLMSYMYLVT